MRLECKLCSAGLSSLPCPYVELLFHMFCLKPLAMGTLYLQIAQCMLMHASLIMYTILGCVCCHNYGGYCQAFEY